MENNYMTSLKSPHTNNPELQFPLKAWSFWLIVATALLCVLDIAIQLIRFDSIISAVTSGLLFLLLGFELYTRLKHKRSYLGKTYSVVICAVLSALLLALYIIT